MRQIHTDLLNLDMLEGKFSEAGMEIAAIRENEDKPSVKAFNGLFEEAYLDARSQTASRPQNFRAIFLLPSEAD